MRDFYSRDCLRAGNWARRRVPRGGIMKKQPRNLFFLLAFFFALFITQCTSETSTQKMPPTKVSAPVITVESREAPEFYEVSGTIISRNPITIVAKVMGTITQVGFVQGQKVEKGVLLAIIDAPDIRASVERAAAAVTEAENGLAMARADAQFAESSFERYQGLYQDKAVSRHEFESVETKKRVAQDQAKRMGSLLSQARAEKARLEAQASFTQIRAPVKGIITLKHVYEGSTVLPGAPLLTMETEDVLRLEVQADERILLLLRQGMTLPVYVSALQKKFTGRVSEIVSAVDPQTRTFRLKIDLPGDPALKLGMYAGIRIPVGTAKKILIPADAIRARGQLAYVFALDANNIAAMRLVRAGKVENGLTEIVSGLSAGEKIVATLNDRVQEGTQVNP
jgi:membrane fusion protein, multidrug efflux system